MDNPFAGRSSPLSDDMLKRKKRKAGAHIAEGQSIAQDDLGSRSMNPGW
jgi:hypothetical protein